MSRALVEDQLSLDAAGIPHLNEESAFVGFGVRPRRSRRSSRRISRALALMFAATAV